MALNETVSRELFASWYLLYYQWTPPITQGGYSVSLTLFWGSLRFSDAWKQVSSFRCLAGLGDVLDESYGNNTEEEHQVELDENHGSTVRDMFSWCTELIFHFCVAENFGPTIHTFVYLCSSKSLRNDKTWHVSSRICIIMKSSRSLTSVLPRLLAFFPLNVTTVVEFLNFHLSSILCC